MHNQNKTAANVDSLALHRKMYERRLQKQATRAARPPEDCEAGGETRRTSTPDRSHRPAQQK